MQREIIIRPMRIDDLDTIYKMEQKLFPNPWPRCFFEKDLEVANTIAFVAEYKNSVIGYLLVACVDSGFHVTNIGVDESYQRQGIASNFMERLERMADARGCTFAYLEVRTNNKAAISFYKKLGYDILYVRKQYYIDGDDAYVMHKEL